MHPRLNVVAAWKEAFFQVDSASLSDDVRFIKSNRIQNIIINGRSHYRDDNLDWIDQISDSLKKLVVTPKSKENFSYTGINTCTNLAYLKLNNRKEDKVTFESGLSIRSLDVANARNLEGLSNLVELRSLTMSDVSDSILSNEVFDKLANLERFSISESELSNGLAFLRTTSVSDICIYRCKHLSLDGIENLKLSTIKLEKIGSLEDFERIFSIDSLESISIIDSLRIGSSESITRLPKLKSLIVLGRSMFEDGDLYPLIHRLESFGFDDRKHYNITHREFKEKYFKS